MEKYCSNCGAELNEGADVCLACGKILKKEESNLPKEDVEVLKEKKPLTPLFNLLSGISFVLVLVFYITAIFESWISSSSYFWIGDDQYIAVFFWFVFLGLAITGYVISNKEFKSHKITRGEKGVATFMFISSLIFIYVVLVQLWWQW